MKNIPERINVSDGLNFTVIKDDRFKTSRISVSMFLPLNKEDASSNAILPFLLSKTCRKYPDFTILNKYLSDLYGTSLSANVEKVGDAQVLSVSATFINDAYTFDSECLSDAVTDLLCDVILDPNVNDGEFLADVVEQEKRQLIELIKAEYNDKKLYSREQCFSVMCDKENFGVHQLGTEEDVKALTGKSIFNAWERLLKHANFEVMILGSFSDYYSIIDKIKKNLLAIKDRRPCECVQTIIKSADKVKRVSKTDEVSQCKMVLGFRTGSDDVDDNVAVFRTLNALFGATPHSKLFLNVREKLSLCYYCASRFYRNKGILTVECGVEKKNIKVAQTEILNQFEEIKKGNFSSEDLSTTKLSLCNSFRTIADYLGGLESFYLMQVFSKDIKTPEDLVEETMSVTESKIKEMAKRITLDTVYCLVNND